MTKVIIYDNITIEEMGVFVKEGKMGVENVVLKEVARQLRAVRRSRGITQEVLAERVGTKKSNISRLESGRYNPSLEFLVKVAGGLGTKLQVEIGEYNDEETGKL